MNFSQSLCAIFLATFCCTVLGLEPDVVVRGKRSLTNLEVMVKCTTGRSPLRYYNGYGCWCGNGGGGTPVDDIDRCCRSHDHCYADVVSRTGCSVNSLKYGAAYDWACRGGNPVCKNAGAFGNKLFYNKCMRPACECDRVFALCLKNKPYPSRKPDCN